LLSDTDKKVHDLYGTWIEKSMYGRKYMGTARNTFIIDGNGVIEEIIEKVDTKNHTDQILKKGSESNSSPKKIVTKKTAVKKTATKNTKGKR
jgi:peroxiredoxin Q/BCP